MSQSIFLDRVLRGHLPADGATLFNCCTDNAEPDWSQFLRLEIEGCRNDGNPAPDHDTSICAGQSGRTAEFFTIYGRHKPDAAGIMVAEAITDCRDALETIRVAAILAARSKLPMTFATALIDLPAEPVYSTEAAAEAMALWEAFLDLTHNAKRAPDTSCLALVNDYGTGAMREEVLASQPHFNTIWRVLRYRHEHVTDGNSYDWDIAPVMLAAAAKRAVEHNLRLSDAAAKYWAPIVLDVLAAFPDREG